VGELLETCQIIARFNLRVYALIINSDREILLADEEYDGRKFSKFPGGGVEYGEGILEALQREAKEELGQELADVKHFYTTDFFQQSEFNKEDQIISFYYTAQLSNPADLKLGKFPFDFTQSKPSFRWVSISQLKLKGLEFPIDKVVLEMV